ncbi:MAG: SHOCT domain-containing protein [Sulfuriferula sp.]
MKALLRLITISSIFAITGCASSPTADPSTVEQACAQQCSNNLTTCSSGFKLFPVVVQKQCNDTYDVCIKGCPARISESVNEKPILPTASERLKKLEQLFKSGTISRDEYESKRKDILNSL